MINDTSDTKDMELTDEAKAKRIEELQSQIRGLASEMRALVAPTNDEIRALLEDVFYNPEVYLSYLGDDDLFIAENVHMERGAHNG